MQPLLERVCGQSGLDPRRQVSEFVGDGVDLPLAGFGGAVEADQQYGGDVEVAGVANRQQRVSVEDFGECRSSSDIEDDGSGGCGVEGVQSFFEVLQGAEAGDDELLCGGQWSHFEGDVQQLSELAI